MSKLTFFVALMMLSTTCRAGNLTLQGKFTADDNVQPFSASITAAATGDIRSYIAALTQYDNFSLGNLTDGFAEAGNPNFTADPSFAGGGACPGNMFRDISGTADRCHNGNWALDFVDVASVTPLAAGPEPSALLLGSLGMVLLLVVFCRERTKATALVSGFLAALANVPVQAQTNSGPDYSNVLDFLNGQRTLLNVTDLQVVRQSASPYTFDDGGDIYQHSNNIESLQVTTSNSQQAKQPPIIDNTTTAQSWYSDSSKPAFSFSAFMFNQAPASTLTTMSNFQQSGNFALWLQNVSGLQGAPGWWEPLAGSSNPNPNVTSGAVADFNLDGYDDLALGFDDGRLLVLTPKDTTNVFANFNDSITTFDVLKAMAAGDFEGNGRREIAGLSVQSDGSLKLEIYTVDPTSLATTLASSLALTMPQGVSANTPVTYVSMARGRFTSAGHDQLAVSFATTTGSPIVEVIDFALNTLNPIQGPQLTESVTIPAGYLEVKTGKFALPGNSYDQIVVHVSSTSTSGRFFHILSVDPTGSLALTAHQAVTYDQLPCAVGIQVGNFDNRQPDPSNPNQSQPNLNAQIALMYCDPTRHPESTYPLNGYLTFDMNIYSADPETLDLINPPDSTLWLGNDIWINPSPTADAPAVSVAFVSTDLQGRSVNLGEPTKITIDNTIQPSVVVGVPPMHVDFIDPGDGNGPRVFNVSVVPDGFKTAYNQQSSSSYASSTTNTTSWSFGAKETGSAGFTIGDPDVAGLKVSDTFTAAQNLKGSHENDYGTYNGTAFNLSATTGFGDQVSYVDSQFNIWVYPVIGQTVCPAPPTPCQSKVPLTIQFSAPDGNSQQPESVEGQALQWYQPPWEPGNIFSYPANFDQLKAHYPDVNLLPIDTTGLLTDGSTITQTVTWTGSGEADRSTGLEQNYSFENDFSVNGAIEFAGIGTEGGYGLDVSGSFGFNNLIKSTTTLGNSTGLEISKPGTFPGFLNYGYSVKPYIVGTVQPRGQVDNQQPSTDVQTAGLLRAVFTADPLSSNPPSGGWWQQAYTAAPDVALNHPSRWTYSALSVPTSGDLPGNCLAVGDGKSMDCAELSQRSPNNPWLDIFHFMRGFFISSASYPGQGPQLEQAKAGDVLTLQARVYNYSLLAMPEGTEVHVRFYFMPWNTTRNLPAVTNGPNSYLISEEKVAAIPEFNESSGPNAQPNWTLVPTTFDTSKFQETKNGNAHLVFWVVVWMQDGSGNLISEMPAHGLTAIPPAGTQDSDGETTVEFSGTQANPGVAQFEECQPPDQSGNVSCYSNNIGLYKQVFYIVPPQLLGASPGPKNGTGTVDIGKIDVSANQITPGETEVLSATLSASGAAASGVSVNFYDGDPKEGGQLFDVERAPYIAADAQYLVQTTYQSSTCGVHHLFAVVNKGKPSEVVRRAHPVRVDCKDRSGGRSHRDRDDE